MVQPGAPESGLARPVVRTDWSRGTILDYSGRDLARMPTQGCAGLCWTLLGFIRLLSTLYILTPL